MQLFRILVLTNHINAARPIGPKLLAKRPHDPEVLYLNGIVLSRGGRLSRGKDPARASRSLSIRTSPTRTTSSAWCSSFSRSGPGAQEQLEKAIAMGATEPQVHFELALALRGLGENDRALKR